MPNVAKQVITQRLREGEQDILFDEYINRQHTFVSGDIMRIERATVIVQMGRAEAILPREEQSPVKSTAPVRFAAPTCSTSPRRASASVWCITDPRQLRP